MQICNSLSLAVFHKSLVKFTKSSRPYSDRSMAIGCYAEVFAEIGSENVLRFTETLMPVVRVGLADNMESVRRNSAFCLGVRYFFESKMNLPMNIHFESSK